MNKDRRLGRGLAALLGTPLEADIIDTPVPASGSIPTGSEGDGTAWQDGLDLEDASTLQTLANQSTPSSETSGLLQLRLGEIEENPFQPRRDFSDAEIVSLAESLKEHDLLQPILVRRVNGRFQLISGERRLRAAKHAGWTTIPARVREADDRLVAELAIVENLQRKDLNPIEKALSFKRYLDEHHCTQDDLARRLKIDRSTIANLMRLLELPGCILDSLRHGTITAGHARALLSTSRSPWPNASSATASVSAMWNGSSASRSATRTPKKPTFCPAPAAASEPSPTKSRPSNKSSATLSASRSKSAPPPAAAERSSSTFKTTKNLTASASN